MIPCADDYLLYFNLSEGFCKCSPSCCSCLIDREIDDAMMVAAWRSLSLNPESDRSLLMPRLGWHQGITDNTAGL
jgi:hypothetical protein